MGKTARSVRRLNRAALSFNIKQTVEREKIAVGVYSCEAFL